MHHQFEHRRSRKKVEFFLVCVCKKASVEKVSFPRFIVDYDIRTKITRFVKSCTHGKSSFTCLFHISSPVGFRRVKNMCLDLKMLAHQNPHSIPSLSSLQKSLKAHEQELFVLPSNLWLQWSAFLFKTHGHTMPLLDFSKAFDKLP